MIYKKLLDNKNHTFAKTFKNLNYYKIMKNKNLNII